MNIVISGQQPPVCFLHCEKLRSQTRRKDLPLASFSFFVSSSLTLSRRTFSARGRGRGVRSHPSHPLPTRLVGEGTSLASEANFFFYILLLRVLSGPTKKSAILVKFEGCLLAQNCQLS